MIWYHIWEWVLILALGVFCVISLGILLGGFKELYVLLFKHKS